MMAEHTGASSGASSLFGPRLTAWGAWWGGTLGERPSADATTRVPVAGGA